MGHLDGAWQCSACQLQISLRKQQCSCLLVESVDVSCWLAAQMAWHQCLSCDTCMGVMYSARNENHSYSRLCTTSRQYSSSQLLVRGSAVDRTVNAEQLCGVASAGDYLHHDVGDMAGAGHVELPAAEISNLEELSKVQHQMLSVIPTYL